MKVPIADLPSYTVGKEADWSLIPEHMIGVLRRYIEFGIEPGGFLEAMLCNDLKNAVGRADNTNKHRLNDYIMFLYNFAPSDCWGSPEKYQTWIDRRGLNWDGIA